MQLARPRKPYQQKCTGIRLDKAATLRHHQEEMDAVETAPSDVVASLPPLKNSQSEPATSKHTPARAAKAGIIGQLIQQQKRDARKRAKMLQDLKTII